MLTKKQLKVLGQIKRANDLCEIRVYDQNLPHAISRLRKQTQLAGTFKYLKIRRWHPTSKARRRAKRIKSLQRARLKNKQMKRIHG
jgi:ribosomal protein S21